MFHVVKLKAEVLLQRFGEDYDTSDEPSYQKVGIMDVDVSDILALPTGDLITLIKTFGAVDVEAASAECPNTSCGSPHTMDEFPSTIMRALQAVHGNMGVVSLKWNEFIESIDDDKELPQGGDDALPQQVEFAKAYAQRHGVLPYNPPFQIFEIEDRFCVAQRVGDTWKDAGSFKTEGDAVLFLTMQKEAASKTAPKLPTP